MTRPMRRRAALTLAFATGLTACTTPKTKISGVQIPVLPPASGLSADAGAPPVTVPPATALADWPQILAGPAHAPGNIAGPAAIAQSWRAGIGAPGGYRQPLQSSPIAAAGRIYTMDANGTISAYAQADGSQQWRRPTRPKHSSNQALGGGIGYDATLDGGTIYAATGYAELLALDAGTGAVKWRQKLDYPGRSAPTIAATSAGVIVALVTQNDLLLTFDAISGTPGWRFIGKVTQSPTSVVVTGAPAYDSGIFVAGFSSGTLAALDAPSGTPLWEQSMASSFGQASPLDFSDVVAPPVIANGVAYAIGLGQTSLAIDLHSGAKVWERDVSGTQAFYLAGGFAYLLDADQKLAAIHADDGLISWITQMPAFHNMKTKSGPRLWNGPIMVDGQLLFTSSRGELGRVDPATGALIAIDKLAGPAAPIDLPPIVAASKLLVLTRAGVLTAYS